MKLAEALVLRADINTRIDKINERIKRCLVIQEGDTAPEDAQTLLGELDQLLTQLNDLITRINRTNLQTLLPQSLSLTAALAQRDVLTRQHGLLTGIADAASERFNRYSNREIRFVTTVDVMAFATRPTTSPGVAANSTPPSRRPTGQLNCSNSPTSARDGSRDKPMIVNANSFFPRTVTSDIVGDHRGSAHRHYQALDHRPRRGWVRGTRAHQDIQALYIGTYDEHLPLPPSRDTSR